MMGGTQSEEEQRSRMSNIDVPKGKGKFSAANDESVMWNITTMNQTNFMLSKQKYQD